MDSRDGSALTRRLLKVWESGFRNAEALAELLPLDLHPQGEGRAACRLAAERILARYRAVYADVADRVGRQSPDFASWHGGEGTRWLSELDQRVRAETVEAVAELAELVWYSLAMLRKVSGRDGWAWCMASLAGLHSGLAAGTGTRERVAG